MYGDIQAEQSHDQCDFCLKQFPGFSERERLIKKKKMLKKLKEIENLDKEEEYFKMCVVS